MFMAALLIFIVLFGIWGSLVFIRKTMWDAVHRNLLDLEDRYSGQVIRRGFASRPVFQGTYEGARITVNFSRDKSGKKHRSCINISYELSCPVSLTIAKKTWLVDQGGNNQKDSALVESTSGEAFVIIPSSGKIIQTFTKSPLFRTMLDELNDLAYLFLGGTGIICEFISEQVIRDTEIEIMEKRLALLKSLTQQLNG